MIKTKEELVHYKAKCNKFFTKEAKEKKPQKSYKMILYGACK